jgi:hypothetical protein
MFEPGSPSVRALYALLDIIWCAAGFALIGLDIDLLSHDRLYGWPWVLRLPLVAMLFFLGYAMVKTAFNTEKDKDKLK